MSAGLTCHGSVLKSLAKVRKEVCGNDRDLAGLSSLLYRTDRALQRLSAAAGRNQSIQFRIRAHQSISSLRATLRGGSCVLRFRQNSRIIRILFIPLVNSGLIAFPSAKPCRVTLLPADEADVSAALVKKNVHKLLTVLRLVLMDRTDIVIRSRRQLIDIRVCFFADDTEELCKIHTLVIAGGNRRGHLGICGVADDDALASCCAELVDRSGDLLGYVTLVNILYFNAKRFSSGVKDPLALGTKNVCRAPDGDTDLDRLICHCRNCIHAEQRRSHGCTQNNACDFLLHVSPPSKKND